MSTPTLTVRPEEPQDQHASEVVCREAFWNFHVPGADEHYLLHILRHSDDFLPQLCLVAQAGGQTVGVIAYSRAWVVPGTGAPHLALTTFGPLAVLPALQGKGVGSALVRQSLKLAAAGGHTAVVIFGDPAYYSRFGFQTAKQFGISLKDGRFPLAMQALELHPGTLKNAGGYYLESSSFHIDPKAAATFDDSFPPKEKLVTESQATFARISQTFL